REFVDATLVITLWGRCPCRRYGQAQPRHRAGRPAASTVGVARPVAPGALFRAAGQLQRTCRAFLSFSIGELGGPSALKAAPQAAVPASPGQHRNPAASS